MSLTNPITDPFPLNTCQNPFYEESANWAAIEWEHGNSIVWDTTNEILW